MKHLLAVMILLFAVAVSNAALQKAPEPEGPIPDLKPPLLEAMPIVVEKRSWLWAWVTGGVLAAGLITTFALASRKTADTAISPYILARKALEAASEGSSPTLVWGIFRNYIHARYGIKRGATAAEIVTGLAAITTIREKTHAEITRLFEECDVARFAGGDNTIPDLVERAMALLNALESQQVTNETPALA